MTAPRTARASVAMLRDRTVALALATCAVTALALLWSVQSAVRLTPTAPVAPPEFVVTDSLATREAAPVLNVPAIVGLNLFSPDRRAPLSRYRLDGENDPVVFSAEPATPPSLPVVVGTAVGPDQSSFAMCSLDDSPVVIVRVGDKLGDYTVRAIARGVVEFSTPSGERISIDANPS